MKTIFTFVLFIAATTLAGIGCEFQNNLALVAGIFFSVLTVAIVFSNSKNDILTSKKSKL